MKGDLTSSARYAELLKEIKARVQAAQVRAGLAANRELLGLYWDIGRMILTRQEAEGWGAKAIENGWSRNVRALQIQSALHIRQGKAVSNFPATLPLPQSDLAQQITSEMPALVVDLKVTRGAPERRNISYFSFSIMA